MLAGLKQPLRQWPPYPARASTAQTRFGQVLAYGGSAETDGFYSDVLAASNAGTDTAGTEPDGKDTPQK